MKPSQKILLAEKSGSPEDARNQEGAAGGGEVFDGDLWGGQSEELFSSILS